MPSIQHLVVLVLVALVSTLFFVPISKKIAKKLDAIDYPSERRINKTPIPRLGGLAMFFGVFVALIFEALGEYFLHWHGMFSNFGGIHINHIGVLGGLAFMTLVGAIDDIFQIKPAIKFGGQIIAAIIIVASGVLLSEIRNPFGAEYIEFGWIAYPLTVLYLIAFANVINLIDGMDGLASGIVCIAAIALLIIAFGKGQVESVILCAVLAGACIGFLRYNFPPASVFMGDSGSLFLGMTLGVISLLGVMRSPTFIIMIIPIVIAGIPIIDTLAAIIRRVRRRLPIQSPDKEHIHHIMLQRGMSPTLSLVIIYGWTVLLSLGGIFAARTQGIALVFIFLALAIASAVVLRFLGLYDPILQHWRNPRKKK